ncbi:TlpA family protein disulfide reductase [Chryseobacterium sp. G0240]|uniref:TlpA family protein disulfide reductase n=1 Tax=Chryseobacterium sp. G0240 TaxID=2487066 RepID=UPI000F4594C3|nr:TlpA disulfide reductase family protein [Chryseobacterium sp. G0240]ROI02517.1 TlpA family protein disulfide reductase [Chryseobacterium sp. G0240]
MTILLKEKIDKAAIILLFFIFCLASHPSIAQANGMVTIRGTIKELKDGDSVKLIRYQYPFLLESHDNEIISYAVVKNNSFIFNISLHQKVEKCRLIFPEYLNHLNWQDGMIAPGHHLNISVKENRLSFSGQGAGLLVYNRLLDSITSISGIDRQGKSREKNFEIIVANISKIENIKNQVRSNDDAFSILRLNKTVGLVSTLYSIAERNDLSGKKFMQKKDDELYHQYLKGIFNNIQITSLPIVSISGLIRARFGCLYPKKQNESKLARDKAYITYLKANFKDPLLAQVLASFLYDNRNTDLLTQDYIDWIIKDTDFSQYNSLLKGIRRFSPGTLLPEFSLTDTLGNEVSLSQFKGNVLVLDFWYTGCFACVRTYKIIKPIIKEFEGKPVKFISISEDKVRDVWVKSIHSGLYTDPQHINLSAGKMGNIHPLFRYFQINAYPTVILIDKNGKIIGSPRKSYLDHGMDLKNKVQHSLDENL